jgi:hypothetical protein
MSECLLDVNKLILNKRRVFQSLYFNQKLNTIFSLYGAVLLKGKKEKEWRESPSFVRQLL